MMDDLIAWLRGVWEARERELDEDERVARLAMALRYDDPSDAPWKRERIIADGLGRRMSRVKAAHLMVAIFADPERVLVQVAAELRDIAAKRRILDHYERQLRAVGPGLADDYPVRCVALPYADLPGYRDAWRPGNA